ncbi:MAG TPA: flagellar export chaperone FliS [Alphaproteobacteria bacterium]|nr:flagellar export chaperone FliS [Alphaproteobacteria bacterium]
MNNPADFRSVYLQQQVANANPLQQLLMLLDGIMKFVSRARECINVGDIQERHNNTRRAMDIVAHLMGMIDVTSGGEPAVRLRRIYGYIMRRLSDIDFKNDPAICDEVMGHLTTMRNAWASMNPVNPQPQQAALPPKPDASAAPMDSAIKRNAVA